MTKKKIEDKNIENKILEIVNKERVVSIRKTTFILDKNYGIKLSPQVVKRYLFKLKKEKKIGQ